MLLTLEILITKCACPSRNAAEGIVPFSCHAYELQASWTICNLQYVNFPFLIATLIISNTQRHLRDSQLWTNAKPMHGVQKMKLPQLMVAGKFTNTNTKQKALFLFLVMWTVIDAIINYIVSLCTSLRTTSIVAILQVPDGKDSG